MFKVVLDTNVYVSSVFWKGSPHRIIDRALDKQIKVFISVDILQELEKVLRRDFEEDEAFIHRQINLILYYAEVVEVHEKVDVVKEDPDDNKILECAKAARVDFVITSDNHLLKLNNFENIPIITPQKFMEML